jgi:hypothetical protein
MRDELLKAGIITQQRADAIRKLSNKKREEEKKKQETESEVHKYEFLDEKFKKKIRIVNKNKEGIILSNGTAEMSFSWKDVKENFHIVDKTYVVPNLKKQKELLELDKITDWFHKRSMAFMGLYSSHRTGNKDALKLTDFAALSHYLEEYQKDFNCTSNDFLKGLKAYFEWMDATLHFAEMRWAKGEF